MRRVALAIAGLVLALAPPVVARGDGFCSPAEGCSPCPPPTVTVDKSGVHIVWICC